MPDTPRDNEKITNLMEASKSIMLNMIDREEIYDEHGKPYCEFAQLYLAYRDMGGLLGISDEEEVSEDCKNLQ